MNGRQSMHDPIQALKLSLAIVDLLRRNSATASFDHRHAHFSSCAITRLIWNSPQPRPHPSTRRETEAQLAPGSDLAVRQFRQFRQAPTPNKVAQPLPRAQRPGPFGRTRHSRKRTHC
jgi:hypothetical protein